MQPCLFCGGDASEPDHLQRCDGRQGRIEAELAASESWPDPVLRARRSDPETSHEAMAAYDPARMLDAAALVVDLHRDHGPLADFQLRPLFEAAYARPCCDHLYQQARSVARDRGQIRDSGERRVNPATGRRQVLWEYCEGAPIEIQRCHICGHVLRRDQHE